MSGIFRCTYSLVPATTKCIHPNTVACRYCSFVNTQLNMFWWEATR